MGIPVDTNTISLNCLPLREGNSFTIQIQKQRTISELKKVISADLKTERNEDIIHSSLIIWKVDISNEDKEKKEAFFNARENPMTPLDVERVQGVSLESDDLFEIRTVGEFFSYQPTKTNINLLIDYSLKNPSFGTIFFSNKLHQFFNKI